MAFQGIPQRQHDDNVYQNQTITLTMTEKQNDIDESIEEEERAKRQGWQYLIGYMPCPAELGQITCGECHNDKTEYCEEEVAVVITWVESQNHWLPVAHCHNCGSISGLDDFGPLLHRIEWVQPSLYS